MGYILLWIEHLTVGLLVAATLVAFLARWRWQVLARGLFFLAALFLLGSHAFVLVRLAWLRSQNIRVGLFYPLVMLVVCLTLGWLVAAWTGLRRKGDPPSVSAAGWPRGKLALLTCLALGLHMMTWWNLDLAVQQRLAMIQVEAGALAVSVAPARLPDRENAALVYDQAWEILDHPDTWEELNQWNRSDGGIRELAEKELHSPELAAFLEARQPALELLHQAAKKPGFHFGRDYGRLNFEMLLPEIQNSRAFTRLLQLDARYHTAQGHVKAALEDTEAMFGIAQHVRSEPFLISVLVAIAIDSIAKETLEEVLAVEQSLPDEDRMTAQQWAAIAPDTAFSYRRLFGRSLRCETASILNAIVEWGCGTGMDASLFDGMFDLQMLPMVESPAAQSCYRLFMAETDVASCRETMDALLALAARPYYEMHEEIEHLYERDDKSWGPLTRCFLPAWDSASTALAEGDARRNAVRLAIAAGRYRAQTGSLPESLEPLVPDYLPMLPLDPFDGQPMRYRLTDDAALIYSVGLDEKDGQGTPQDRQQPTTAERRLGDIVFRLAR